VFASNDWADDQGKEDHKKDKVQNCVSYDSALTQSALLKRIDWRTDLTAVLC
jgi:hypothetical protein